MKMIDTDLNNKAKATVRLKMTYAVTFQEQSIETVSRFFETKRAARKWANWLKSRSFRKRDGVRILMGGPGGIEVQ